MLSASLKSLGVTFKLDCRILAFEYHDAVPTVMLLYEKELRAQKDAPASGGDHTWFDNRLVWAKFLDKSFVESAFPGRVAPFTVLPRLLRVWLSILDGEAQVERDLGFMRGFAKAGKGRSHDQLLEDLLILKTNGPKTGEEVGGNSPRSAPSYGTSITGAQQCTGKEGHRDRGSQRRQGERADAQLLQMPSAQFFARAFEPKSRDLAARGLLMVSVLTSSNHLLGRCAATAQRGARACRSLINCHKNTKCKIVC